MRGHKYAYCPFYGHMPRGGEETSPLTTWENKLFLLFVCHFFRMIGSGFDFCQHDWKRQFHMGELSFMFEINCVRKLSSYQYHWQDRLLLEYTLTLPSPVSIILTLYSKIMDWSNCYVLKRVLERNSSCCLLFSHNNPVWDLFAVQCSASKFSKVSLFPSIILPLLHCVISIWFGLSAKLCSTYSVPFCECGLSSKCTLFQRWIDKSFMTWDAEAHWLKGVFPNICRGSASNFHWISEQSMEPGLGEYLLKEWIPQWVINEQL